MSFGAAALFVAFVVWQVAGWGDDRSRVVISDLAPLPLEIAATTMALLAARAADGAATRRAWLLIAAAFAFYGAGDALWAWFEVVRDTAPFPSLADVGYVGFYPLLFAGLLILPGRRRPRAEAVQLLLDVLIVVLASSTAVWYFAINGLVDGAGWSASTVLSLAYPVGDVVLIFAIATVLLRGVRTSSTQSVRMLLVGVSSFVVADVGFGHLSLSGSYVAPDWPDTFWILALACMVASAECHYRTSRGGLDVELRSERTTRRIPILPYAAIIGGYGLLVAVAHDRVVHPVHELLVGAVALTGVVVLRQLAALHENIALTDEFRRLATTDGLTGLVNRRHFVDLAERELARSRQHSRPMALFMIDVDRFKTINDTFGHAVGDEVLKWLAAQCRVNLRPTDVISRFGGDEFVVLLPNTTIDVAVDVAHRLVAAVGGLSRPIAAGPERISLSLGVASTDGCADIDTVLGCADGALYEAKAKGRGQAAIHPVLVSSPTGSRDHRAALVSPYIGRRH